MSKVKIRYEAVHVIASGEVACGHWHRTEAAASRCRGINPRTSTWYEWKIIGYRPPTFVREIRIES